MKTLSFMKRSLSIFLLLISFLSSFSQNKEPQVTVTREIIKHTTPGEYEVRITLTSTGPVTGYARYKEVLPVPDRDVKYTCIKNGGASFSANDTEIKFLWTAVGLSDTLEISYLVENAKDIRTDLPGTFGFIVNNVVHTIKLEEKNMTYSEKK